MAGGPGDCVVVQTMDPGTFYTALAGAVATAARLEDVRVIQAAVKELGGMSSLPAWAKAAT